MCGELHASAVLPPRKNSGTGCVEVPSKCEGGEQTKCVKTETAHHRDSKTTVAAADLSMLVRQ